MFLFPFLPLFLLPFSTPPPPFFFFAFLSFPLPPPPPPLFHAHIFTMSLFLENAAKKRRVRKLFFEGRRFENNGNEEDASSQITKWRMKERMKTVGVALVCCLNIGVDPPDVIKNSPCARMECWIEPTSEPAPTALEGIGRALQSQYERWQPRARYERCLDKTVDDVKKLTTSLRRFAKGERVLFHYNGHGVPKPTSNGEIWVFNKDYTQYIPLSLYELQTWMAGPSIYVFDCSAAGLALQWYAKFAEKREGLMQNSILLGACGVHEVLPTNPNFPADVFTACLTTPVKMALRWFCSTNQNRFISPDLIEKIPGRVGDRRTVLGQLDWIFTAITDTIAWNVLPPALFQKLFRQDLLVASLFRNFLLAERILRSAKCNPVSIPKLPPTSHHPMWRSWDLAADLCLSHLAKLTAHNPSPPPSSFPRSSFFEDQLIAFEVWLQFASGCDTVLQNRIPEQLPIILQVLLSQTHRLRALLLLARFLDLGLWAVNLALSVGIFPYVVKLLQSPSVDLRQVLVFIWAKLLAIDKSCQLDLVKDNGHNYFLSVLNSAATTISANAASSSNSPSQSSSFTSSSPSSSSSFSSSSPSPNSASPSSCTLSSARLTRGASTPASPARGNRPSQSTWFSPTKLPRFTTGDLESSADDYTLAAFVLSVVCDNCRPGQIACLSCGLLPLCLTLLPEAHPLLRFWLVFCLGKLWEDFEEAKAVAIREGAHERLCALLTDSIPEVRAAAVFSIGTLIAGSQSSDARINIELNLGLTLVVVIKDSSPLVRKEFVVALYHFTCGYQERFQEAITELHDGEIQILKSNNLKPKRSPAPLLSSRTSKLDPDDQQSGGVFQLLWKVLLGLRNDPFPEVASGAENVIQDLLRGCGIILHLPPGTTTTIPSGAPNAPPPSLEISAPPNSSFRPLSKRRHLLGALTPSREKMNEDDHSDDETRSSGKFDSSGDERGSGFGNLLRRFGSDLPKIPEELIHSTTDSPRNSGSRDSGSSDPSYEASTRNSAEIEVRSNMFLWACGNLSARLLQPANEDETAPHYLRRVWRNVRKNEALGEAIRMGGRGVSSCRKFEDQLAIIDNSSEHTSHLLFHPFDDILVTCDLDQIQVWSWREGVRMAMFGNGNSPGSHLSGILLINDHDQPLVCTASSDGVIRVWDHPSISNPAEMTSYITGGRMNNINSNSPTPYLSVPPKLVTSFQVLSDLGPKKRFIGQNTIVDWQQESGMLFTSGDVNVIRVWNMEKELHVQDISVDSCVVALSNDAPQNSRSFILAGCEDGSIKMFDSRSSSRFTLSSTISERKARVLAVHRSKSDLHVLVGAHSDGSAKIWDIRKLSQPTRTVSCVKGDATAATVHSFLPLFAVGSTSQKVKVFNFEGEELSMIRYHDGFLGQRIGPLSCLAFHPYRAFLAAGARDSIVSVYGGVVSDKSGT